MEHQTSSTPASQESKAHLRHILASEPTLPPASLKVAAPATEPDPTPEHVVPPSSSRKKAEREPAAQNKMRFLKKDDGTPFWRRDIQYKLLESIFNDDKKLFTKMSDQTRGHTFADVYVDAMARSSKCSKLLQEKLLSDTLDLSVIPARDMAMVCLLVNVGRMNTTVNFFPEMRARVRTFHSIPSLQARQGPSASKQLQDGPRLKSILKGCQEDTPQPTTLYELFQTNKPRTNPVSMVFLLQQFAPKISEAHFEGDFDFFDIFMKDHYSSESRARAFLWLVWWYLESDFTADDAKNNPYGPGTMVLGFSPREKVYVPPFVAISEKEAENENVDPPHEVEFGEQKRKEREDNLASDDPPSANGKRGAKGSGVDKAGNMHVEPKAETPLPDISSPEQKTSDSLNLPQSTVNHSAIDGNRSPMLAPAPHFIAANSPAPSTGQKHPRTPSRSPSRDIKLPKLRPNLSQRSNDSMQSNEVGGPERPQNDSRTHSGVGHYLAPHDATPSRLAPDLTSNESPRHESWGPSKSAPDHHHHHHHHHNVPPHHHHHHHHHQHQPGHHHRSRTPTAPSQVLRQHSQYPPADTPYAPRHPYLNGNMGRRGTLVPPSQVLMSSHEENRRPSNIPIRPLTAETLRLEKVGQVVKHNLHVLQRAKRHERKRRGIIADAWIKARSLPSGWDSEEDEFGRMGGIDDVRSEGGIAVDVKVGEAGEVKRWDVGDAGLEAAVLADVCRRTGQALKSLYRPLPLKTANKRKERDEGRDNDAARYEERDTQSRRPSNFPEPPPLSDQRYQAPAPPSLFLPQPSQAAIQVLPSFPRPFSHDREQRKQQKRRRNSSVTSPADGPSEHILTLDTTDGATYSRNASGSAASPEKAYTWTPKGRKRMDSDTVTPGTRPGEIGYPVGQWPDIDENKVKIEAVTGGSTRRRRRSTLTKAEGIASAPSASADLETHAEGHIEGDNITL